MKNIKRWHLIGYEEESVLNREITEDEYRKMLINQETETLGLLPPQRGLPLEVKESKKYTWLDRVKGLVPIYGIDRHRLSTDGKGITTLVAFHKCLLNRGKKH